MKSNSLDIPPRQSLMNLGFDSLMAVELKNCIEKDLSIVIPLSYLMTDANVEDFTSFLLSQIPNESGATEPVPGPGSEEEEWETIELWQYFRHLCIWENMEP